MRHSAAAQLLVAAAAVSSAAAQPTALNLTGSWLLSASYLEGYTLTPQAPGSLSTYTAACVQGPCTGWKTGVVTVLSPSTGAVHVAFDSGVAHDGVYAAGGAPSIAWADGSAWTVEVPLPSQIDVHLFPHSHDDPGWILTIEEVYTNYITKIYPGMV